jgi:hypothetical protein
MLQTLFRTLCRDDDVKLAVSGRWPELVVVATTRGLRPRWNVKLGF